MSARSPSSVAPASPKVLLTGFEAFGGASINPSWQAAQALHGRQIARHRVVAAQLPTAFDASLGVLSALLAQHQPALVVCLGQAGGRAAIGLERVAINLNDAPLADNAGAQPIDTPVITGAPAAYFSSLPVKAMRAVLQREGIAAEVSQTAGTFVCNHIFFGLMHVLATHRALRHTRGGFVHVPWLPEQGTPSMALDELVRGLSLAVRCALLTGPDAPLAAGATH